MKVAMTRYDVAEHLRTPEEMVSLPRPHSVQDPTVGSVSIE